MTGEMLDQLCAPPIATLRVAQRVELERDAADAKLGEQLCPEGERFDVRLRFAGADDLGIQLVELAEAALLRALIAEGGAVGRDLERGILLPTFGQIGARDPGRELRPQRDRIARTIVEAVHFLRHHVGGLAHCPREHRGRLNHRDFDPLEPIQTAHAIERGDHRVEAVGVFSDQALRPPDGLRRHGHYPRLSIFAFAGKAWAALWMRA